MLRPYILLFPLPDQPVIVLLPYATVEEIVRAHGLRGKWHLAPGGGWWCLADHIWAVRDEPQAPPLRAA